MSFYLPSVVLIITFCIKFNFQESVKDRFCFVESNSFIAVSCNKFLKVKFCKTENIIWRTNYRSYKNRYSIKIDSAFTGVCNGHKCTFNLILLVETWRVCEIQWSEEDLVKGWGMFKLPRCQQLGGTWLRRLEEERICHRRQKPGK